MRDTSGELAERGKFLCLNQGGPAWYANLRAIPSPGAWACSPHFFQQLHLLDGDHGLIGKGFNQLYLLWHERRVWSAQEPRRLWLRLRASEERQAVSEIHQLSGLQRSRIPDRLKRLECESSCPLLQRVRPRYRAREGSDFFA